MHHSIFKEACHNYDGLDCRVSPSCSNCFTDAADATWIHNKLSEKRENCRGWKVAALVLASNNVSWYSVKRPVVWTERNVFLHDVEYTGWHKFLLTLVPLLVHRWLSCGISRNHRPIMISLCYIAMLNYLIIIWPFKFTKQLVVFIEDLLEFFLILCFIRTARLLGLKG